MALGVALEGGSLVRSVLWVAVRADDVVGVDILGGAVVAQHREFDPGLWVGQGVHVPAHHSHSTATAQPQHSRQRTYTYTCT